MAFSRLREYVKLMASEPEALRIVGERSIRNGTNKLSSREIDRIIQATRAQKNRPIWGRS